MFSVNRVRHSPPLPVYMYIYICVCVCVCVFVCLFLMCMYCGPFTDYDINSVGMLP